MAGPLHTTPEPLDAFDVERLRELLDEPLGTSPRELVRAAVVRLEELLELERVTEKALGLVELDIEAEDAAEPGGAS